MHVQLQRRVFGEAQIHHLKSTCQRSLPPPRLKRFVPRGINIVSDGTDTHLVLVDLRNLCITGLAAETAWSLLV